MAASTLFGQPYFQVRDLTGLALIGAKVTFFEAGTSSPLDVWHDPDLSVAWIQPIVTDAAGQSYGPIYVSPTPAIKIVVVDADDVPVDGFPFDFYSPAAVAT